MPEDLKKLETLDYRAESPINYRGTTLPSEQPIKTGCAVKSSNIEIIKEIEDLMSQVNDKLNSIDIQFTTDKPKPWQAKDLALEEIDLFQRTALFELRKAFE